MTNTCTEARGAISALRAAAKANGVSRRRLWTDLRSEQLAAVVRHYTRWPAKRKHTGRLTPFADIWLGYDHERGHGFRVRAYPRIGDCGWWLVFENVGTDGLSVINRFELDVVCPDEREWHGYI